MYRLAITPLARLFSIALLALTAPSASAQPAADGASFDVRETSVGRAYQNAGAGIAHSTAGEFMVVWQEAGSDPLEAPPPRAGDP